MFEKNIVKREKISFRQTQKKFENLRKTQQNWKWKTFLRDFGEGTAKSVDKKIKIRIKDHKSSFEELENVKTNLDGFSE